MDGWYETVTGGVQVQFRRRGPRRKWRRASFIVVVFLVYLHVGAGKGREDKLQTLPLSITPWTRGKKKFNPEGVAWDNDDI